MDTGAGVCVLREWKNRCQDKTLTTDSETFALKPDHKLHTVQLTLHTLKIALREIAHPLLTQLNYCRQLSTATQ